MTGWDEPPERQELLERGRLEEETVHKSAGEACGMTARRPGSRLA